MLRFSMKIYHKSEVRVDKYYDYEMCTGGKQDGVFVLSRRLQFLKNMENLSFEPAFTYPQGFSISKNNDKKNTKHFT